MKKWHTFTLLSGLVLSAHSLLGCQAVPPAIAPEPATFELLGGAAGVVLLAGYLRRRKK
jgi:hypothetical protein